METKLLIFSLTVDIPLGVPDLMTYKEAGRKINSLKSMESRDV